MCEWMWLCVLVFCACVSIFIIMYICVFFALDPNKAWNLFPSSSFVPCVRQCLFTQGCAHINPAKVHMSLWICAVLYSHLIHEFPWEKWNYYTYNRKTKEKPSMLQPHMHEDLVGKGCGWVAFKFGCINYCSIIITWLRLWRFIYTLILLFDADPLHRTPIPNPSLHWCLHSSGLNQFAKFQTYNLNGGNIHLILHSLCKQLYIVAFTC